MVFHILAISKQKESSIGYVFSSEKLSLVRKDLKTLRDDANSAHAGTYAIHSLTTDSYDIQSIISYDNYFEGVQFTSSKSEFIDELKMQLTPTSLEVASYIQKKFSLASFVLMKTVYYLYADYLEANKKPLFKAKFEAWKDGPVDRDVYRLKRHHVGELKKLDDIRVKQTNDFDILSYIDRFVEQNAEYLDSVRFTQNNPTHKPDTPWSVVMQSKGQNGTITDHDIIEHHSKERILA
ncbi:hypothetical protein CRI85_02695 [Leuconostoc pseudomesenteroides]|uniref:Panacea domain-containing protein n=1 Tax=Leuconostoc pseudomesenteroides TaxID=33968 RepID=UPI001E5FE4F1|nr:type II toxin-antitoxin system antitoxin SocA domain-containing protein [Leuconostoc pseudomesenteroides]MCC8439256.1 hypothetical protein [Leuconostoc pseudomesenteroides]